MWYYAVISYIVCVIIILLLLPIANYFSLVDIPTNRKLHAGNIPYIGGVSIIVSSVATYCYFVAGSFITDLLFLCGIATVVIGLFDDKLQLSATIRFIFQLLIGLIIAYSVKLSFLGNLFFLGDIYLNIIFAYILTVIAIAGLMNGANMLDGLDGLLGCVALSQLAVFTGILFHHQEFILAMIGLIFCGAIIGFLTFNFPWFGSKKAKIFMGDNGSMLLGLILAWYAIITSQAGYIYPVTALWIMLITIYDTIYVMLNRLFHGKSPFFADRQHLHYVLVDCGYPKNIIPLIYVIITALTTILGFILERLFVSSSFFIFVILSVAYYWLRASKCAIHN